MATQRGWWSLEIGELRNNQLSDADRQHIAECIINDCFQGEIVEEEYDKKNYKKYGYA